MNILSIVYCDNQFYSEHRIVAENALLFEATPTREIHLIVLSPFATKFNKPHKIGENIWVYQYSSKNWFLKLPFILKNIFLIKKKNQVDQGPWIYSDSSKMLGFVYKKIDVVLTDEMFISQVVGYFTVKYFNAVLSVVFVTDYFSFFTKNIFNTSRIPRVCFSHFLNKRAAAISLATVLLQNRFKKIYSSDVRMLEKLQTLPRYVDFEALEGSERTVNLHQKYPKFKFTVLLHTQLMKSSDLTRCKKIIDLIRPHFGSIGFIVVGDTNKLYGRYLLTKLGFYNKYFVFEGNSRDWQRDPVAYFSSANMFVMRPDIELYDTLLLYAFAGTCPIVTIRDTEMESFFSQDELFLTDNLKPEQVSKIIMDVVNNPSMVKEKSISMRNGVTHMFGETQLSYKQYLTDLFNSFLFTRNTN